ncbi:MAG TPA: S66 peptidase family protein [Methanomassiliicoccales archaeon]|jgi:muramoyltetrapeptide carboxypeptidase
MDLVKPKRVKSGGIVRLVAPSLSASILEPRVWDIGIRRLESKGLKVQMAKHAMGSRGHASGTIQERSMDIMDAFLDPEVDLVMSVIGGFNSNQLLPELDYKAIRESRKAFIGFSDVTALNIAILARSGLVNFHGPAFVTFCQPEMSAYAERSFDQVLLEGSNNIPVEASENWAEDRWFLNENLGPREWKNNPGWDVLREGHAKGRAVGGNLSTLMLLAGTEYWPDMNGAILFLEDDGSATPEIFDRDLTHLKQMGVFDNIYGLVVGRSPSEAGFGQNDSMAMIIDDLMGECDIPVVAGIDIGHTDPMFTIPLGTRCELSTDRKKLTFVEKAVE